MKRRRIYVDFETACDAELRGQSGVGVYNYATHPTCRALMLGWAVNNKEVQIWFPEWEPMPRELQECLSDPNTDVVAFNSTFERYIFKFVLGIELEAERFQDPQPSARYLSLPASLEDVGPILGLPIELQKDKEGERLIKIFCKPSKKRKKRGEAAEYYYKDRHSNPEDWQKFVDYCKQDVAAERESLRRLHLLGVWPLPPIERRIWIMDQAVNDVGVPFDRRFVECALRLGENAKAEAIDQMNKLTGLENSNSGQQLLEWVRGQGYEPESLDKRLIESQLEFNDKLTPLCKKVLTKRLTAASTSYKKFQTLLLRGNADNRVRNLFEYMGSSRCGRWSSGALQFHNMARPEEMFEDLDTLNWARAMIYAEDYEAIQLWFGKPTAEESDPGSVLSTLKSCIRTAFVAPEGSEFAVADLNAIETRVGAWVSGCVPLLDVFRTYLCVDHPQYMTTEPEKYNHTCPDCGKRMKTKDPYVDFATKMQQLLYETIAKMLKSKDPAERARAKRWRQIAKPGMLGCIYRLSAGMIVMKKGVPTKTGLFGYAANMKIKMTQEEAQEIVKVFRSSYKEIVEFWYLLEKLIKEVLNEETVQVKRACGPNDCIKIDKVLIQGRDPILRIQLPSGRYLHYMDASVKPTKMPWQVENEAGEPEDVYKPALVYSGQNQTTHQWSTITSHGGKVFENIVQGIARDVLAYILLRLYEVYYMKLCAHVHDEGVVQKFINPFEPGCAIMEHEMSQEIAWAPGLPLKGEGFNSAYYHK